MFSPFDFNEADRHRRDHVEDRLKEGSPIVGVSFDAGLLLLTVRQTQRKVFEIYDRLAYSAMGHQSDVEAIRVGSINFAHQEGFDRSPDDVTAQRLVGFQLSPPLKRLFGDQFNAPAVIRAIFGELGTTPAEDAFFILNYDGEFTQAHAFAAIAGAQEAEDRMALWLMGVGPDTSREQALERSLKAWAVGAMESRRKHSDNDEENVLDPLLDVEEGERLVGFLRQELKTSQVEVGILERHTTRESKFKLLSVDELKDVLKEYV
jgi:proteasome alpha subunit